MYRIGLGREDRLSSLIIVRNRPETDPTSQISSFALFTIIMRRQGDLQFELQHRRFDPIRSQDAIITELCELIPDSSQLIVRQHMLPRSKLLGIANGTGRFPPCDNQKIAGALSNVTLLPLYVSESQLTASGEAIGLVIPAPQSIPLARNHWAPVQAMALWAIYARAFGAEDETHSQLAAFQAWYLLERLKAGSCRRP